VKIAKGCGYENTVSVEAMNTLQDALHTAKKKSELSFIEAKCAIGSRENLGRPTTTARENKELFMQQLVVEK